MIPLQAVDDYTCYNKRCFPDQIQYERWFTVGKEGCRVDSGSLLIESGEPVRIRKWICRRGRIRNAVTKASIFVYECNDEWCSDFYSQWLTDVGDDPVMRFFWSMLPVGQYELLVHKKGSTRFQ